ncbi:MAG: hypothetical protein GY719_19210 [bacterium]|nr:hypothetical protein [bacterium]
MPAAEPAAPPDPAPSESGEATYVEGIQRALFEEMERDDKIVILGQDIGAFEGAFRITRGLHQRWPERVLDTPIAESGTLGIAAGAALLGAGPFHSQNPEAWFTHVAGLKVVCPATAEDAKGLLKSAIRDPNPVIYCEHKFLYRRIKAVLPGPGEVAELGRAAVRREGSDLTLVAYGATVWTALEVAEELSVEGVEAEVVDLRTLVPLDEETVIASVRKTNRALIVHEAQGTSGFGGEVAARIAEHAFPWLDAPIRRMDGGDRDGHQLLEVHLEGVLDGQIFGSHGDGRTHRQVGHRHQTAQRRSQRSSPHDVSSVCAAMDSPPGGADSFPGGRVKKKIEPSPSPADSTQMRPPWTSMIFLAMARPMPVPSVPVSNRSKRPKTLS